jgi:hypothetical protein
MANQEWHKVEVEWTPQPDADPMTRYALADNQEQANQQIADKLQNEHAGESCRVITD